MKCRFWAVSIFGVEAITADEIRRMGFENVTVETGRVMFDGDIADLPRINMSLRTCERVLVSLGEFPARTFTELFDGVKALPWESFLPENAEFPVNGHSFHSALFSISDCQSIVKKAVVERLKSVYALDWFPEDGARYGVRFSISDDIARLGIDTTGDSLHKRGYRSVAGEAPISETLAAALVLIARYRGFETLTDPMCGSGTILIEAALIAQNRAPGLRRSFDCEAWKKLCPAALWSSTRAELRAAERLKPVFIHGSDINGEIISVARENAAKAGLGALISFEQKDLRSADIPEGVMITNPPYGERLLDKPSAAQIESALGDKTKKRDDLRRYIITADMEFERLYGQRADKKRKLYNGMIKCDYYMYTPKPAKKISDPKPGDNHR